MINHQPLANLPNNFAIVSLSDHPELLAALVDQQWEEWGYDEREDLLEFFKQEFTDEMPRTWMLIDKKLVKNANIQAGLIGAVTLSIDEMGVSQPPERNPWLGYLFIEPHYRGQGLAKYLTQFAVEQAHCLGYKDVYLYASDETARYQKWGWEILETLEFQSEEVNVMRKFNSKK